jgi:hypothetical protein
MKRFYKLLKQLCKRNSRPDPVKMAEKIIEIIEHLLCAMELLRCYMDSRDKRKRKWRSPVKAKNRMLDGIGNKIVEIVQRYVPHVVT